MKHKNKKKKLAARIKDFETSSGINKANSSHPGSYTKLGSAITYKKNKN